MQLSKSLVDKLDVSIAEAVEKAIKEEREACAKIALEWATAFNSGRECECEQAAWRIYEDIKKRDEQPEE